MSSLVMFYQFIVNARCIYLVSGGVDVGFSNRTTLIVSVLSFSYFLSITYYFKFWHLYFQRMELQLATPLMTISYNFFL